MSFGRRDKAAEEISRFDPRFRCQMCGRSIFGIVESDKTYDTRFYCSKDCENAYAANLVGCSVVVLTVFWSGILGLVYNGTLPTDAITAVFVFLILDILLAARFVQLWSLREQIIRNRPNTARE
ncbi:MAG: hypothetical protein ACFFE1_15130 [Candidatus Thorarchaeota archaeon]